MRVRHACSFAALIVVSGVGLAQVSLISTDSSGANFDGDAIQASISKDGRYVAFRAAGAFNGGIYIKDRQTGATIPVSVPVSGGAAMAARYPAVSADGSCIAFESGLVLDHNDLNGVYDVYVRDLTTSTTTRVSVSSSGAEANNHSGVPSISGDGRFVVFESYASNLTPSITPIGWNVYVHDRTNATTRLVSVNASGGAGAGWSRYPSISADGRWVVFESTANDLVLPDNLLIKPEIYVRDLITGSTIRVSLTPSGAQAKGTFFNGYSYFSICRGTVSDDGRYIAFLGDAGLDASYPTLSGLYVRDMSTGSTQIVNRPLSGIDENMDVEGGNMSSDGRFIAFSTRDRITSDDLNVQVDSYVRDMLLGTQTRISRELPGQIHGGFENSGGASLSGDGAVIAFESTSRKLATNDIDNNSDVYVHDWGLVSPVAYCTAGTSSQGCVATLTATGTPSGSAGSGFTLRVTGADGQRSALLLYGINGRQALPWGSSSFACIAPPRQRTGLQSTGGTGGTCLGSLSLDWNAYVASHPFALGAPFTAMRPVQAQAYVRDVPSGSALSNALEFYAVP